MKSPTGWPSRFSGSISTLGTTSRPRIILLSSTTFSLLRQRAYFSRHTSWGNHALMRFSIEPGAYKSCVLVKNPFTRLFSSPHQHHGFPHLRCFSRHESFLDSSCPTLSNKDKGLAIQNHELPRQLSILLKCVPVHLSFSSSSVPAYISLFISPFHYPFATDSRAVSL